MFKPYDVVSYMARQSVIFLLEIYIYIYTQTSYYILCYSHIWNHIQNIGESDSTDMYIMFSHKIYIYIQYDIEFWWAFIENQMVWWYRVLLNALYNYTSNLSYKNPFSLYIITAICTIAGRTNLSLPYQDWRSLNTISWSRAHFALKMTFLSSIWLTSLYVWIQHTFRLLSY